jgi:hypothetical protein
MPEAAPRPDTQTQPRMEDLGLSPELLTSWVLRRVHRGEVAKSGDQYVSHGRLKLSHLTRTSEELIEAGLLTLAEEDPRGLRPLSLTETGHAHYAQLTTPRMTLSVPGPEFPPMTPAWPPVELPRPPLLLLAASRPRTTR